MSPLALSLHFLQAQPDGRLIALAREGHEPAFEALVRRYRKELLAYCRRLQPHSGGAEDALQQTLLQAWRALKAGAEVREARPWLYRIAHNVSLNQLRVSVGVPQSVAEAAAGQDVHQLVEQRLQARAALAGMASLPPLQRDVLISTTLNGASHEEVATTLGLSSGAVRGLIYRARATLRSAAAAITPTPALHWMIRRTETRAGAGRAITEALAGGGGAGVAAAISKGGVVLTLAGAVAGASGVISGPTTGHHRRPEARLTASSMRAQPALDRASVRQTMGAVARRTSEATKAGRGGNRSGAPAGERDQGFGSLGQDRRGVRSGSTDGSGDDSSGGSKAGSSTGSSGGSDGGSSGGATTSGDGTTGSSSGGSSGGSDGGSSGGATTSSDGTTGSSSGDSSGSSGDSSGSSSGGSGDSSGSSTSTIPGSDGGTSGASDGQLTTSITTLTTTSGSDGGPGSDGGRGPDGGSTSSSASAATTTTSS